MGDEHYMEDENEWPYLVWEKKDPPKRNVESKPRRVDLDFEDIPFREFPSYVGRLAIASGHRNRIVGSIHVSAKNCTFSLHQGDGEVRISLDVKNEYVSSRFNGTYGTGSSQLTFYVPYHDHGGLESLQWFKSEVKRVEAHLGLKYYGVGGGYEFEWENDELTVKDEFEFLVYFSDDDYHSDTHSYKIDFEKRRLVKYHVHDWLEMFEPAI